MYQTNWLLCVIDIKSFVFGEGFRENGNVRVFIDFLDIKGRVPEKITKINIFSEIFCENRLRNTMQVYSYFLH